MSTFPPLAAKIVGDYLARVSAQLGHVPVLEREEFLREVSTHLYDAYQQEQGDDEVAGILAVLRKFGEPSEVVAERLPEAMVRAGTRRNLPVLILSGILIAMFGVPLGFGGVAVLAGVLISLASVVLSYYAVAGAIVLSGAVLVVCGLMRIFGPAFWERLVTLGYIQINGLPGELFEQLSVFGQGMVLILLGAMLAAAGLAMLWLGRHLLRGLRFFCGLLFDWTRRCARAVRRRFSRQEERRLAYQM